MSPWVSIMTASLKYQRDYNPGAVVEFSPEAPVTIIFPVPVLNYSSLFKLHFPHNLSNFI